MPGDKRPSLKFERTAGGSYKLAEWIITRTEGEFRSPGYTWFAHDGESDEQTFGSLESAKSFVRKQITNGIATSA